LKADIDGPQWIDLEIAEAFNCRTKTVENIRQRLVTEGFSNWSLRLLAERVVELGLVESILDLVTLHFSTGKLVEVATRARP